MFPPVPLIAEMPRAGDPTTHSLVAGLGVAFLGTLWDARDGGLGWEIRVERATGRLVLPGKEGQIGLCVRCPLEDGIAVAYRHDPG